MCSPPFANTDYREEETQSSEFCKLISRVETSACLSELSLNQSDKLIDKVA